MLISALLSLLIFAGYIAYIIWKFKIVPQSLSNTFYMLDNRGFIFTLMIFTIAFLLLPPMIEVTNPMFQFVAFFCLASIGFVGAAPNFKEEMDGKVHTIAAYTSAVAGIIWTALLTNFWWLILVFIIICGHIAYKTNTIESSKIWWLEMIAFGSVYSAILLTLI